MNPSQQPAASSQQPAASSQQPAASSQQPAAIIIDALSDAEWRKEFERMTNELHAQFPHLSSEDAKDVLDDGLTQLILNPGIRFRDLSECCASIFTRGRHLLQHVQRTNGRTAPLEEAMELGIEDEGVVMFMLREHLDVGLEMLSGEDRELVLAHFGDKKTIRDLAKEHNETVAKIESRVKRPMMVVKENFKKMEKV